MNSAPSFPPADPDSSPSQPSSSSTFRRPHLTMRRFWKEILETVLIIAIIYTSVNLSTARANVLGPSMQPNFWTGELLIANRAAYFFADPQRGDVIMLNNPAERCQAQIASENSQFLPSLSPIQPGDCDSLLKRIIGLPRETVQITKGVVYINGTKLDEPYISPENFCDVGCDANFQLSADEYLVLGDNRSHSYDGHNFGPINRKLIVGSIWMVYWPINQAKLVPHPQYGLISTTPLALLSPTPSNP